MQSLARVGKQWQSPWARLGSAVRMTGMRYLWAAPNSVLGLILALPSLVLGRCRLEQGVLEVWGGALPGLLGGLPWVPGGAVALTLGHVVLGRDPEVLLRTRAHERAHVRQAEVWGPLFLPAYGMASLWALVRGRHVYRDNAFERAARACEDAGQ